MGDLRKRVISGLLAGPAIIAVFAFLPPFWLFLFLCLVGLMGVLELTAIAGMRRPYLLIILILCSFVALYLRSLPSFLFLMLGAPAAWMLIRIMAGGGREEGINGEIVKGTAMFFFGVFLVIVPLFHLYLLKERGALLPLIFLITLWASDTGAYFFGKNFGRKPLVPQISPKKTYEGLLGAMVGSMVIMSVAHGILGVTIPESLVLGASIGILGQLGDVLESAGKRFCNVKDSSNLIPGHGGILDRIDSFIFTSPFLYYYLTGVPG